MNKHSNVARTVRDRVNHSIMTWGKLVFWQVLCIDSLVLVTGHAYKVNCEV